MAEIRCSAGVFNNKEELAEYFGRSVRSLNDAIGKGRRSGLSEADVIERLILCSKVKKEFNLKTLPSYINIVLFYGKYYPSVRYLSKLMGWNNATVLNLMKTGMSLEEIDLRFKQKGSNTVIKAETFALLKSKVDENSNVFVENEEVIIEVRGKKYKSIPDLVNDYDISLDSFRKRLKRPGVSIYQALSKKRWGTQYLSLFWVEVSIL